MAKTRRTGPKSDAVRELLAAQPGMRNSEIIAELAKRRIKVTPALVSQLRARANGKSRKRDRTAGASDTISLATLVEAKQLAERLGGVENAARVMRALAELSG